MRVPCTTGHTAKWWSLIDWCLQQCSVQTPNGDQSWTYWRWYFWHTILHQIIRSMPKIWWKKLKLVHKALQCIDSRVTKTKVCDPHWRNVGSQPILFSFWSSLSPSHPPYCVQWSDCSATKFYVVHLCYILQTVNFVARWHCWCWSAEGGLLWREVIVDKGHGSPHITLRVMDWYT